VTESEISENIASEGDGDTIHSDKVATVDIKKSDVTNNFAGTSGGALSVHNLDKVWTCALYSIVCDLLCLPAACHGQSQRFE